MSTEAAAGSVVRPAAGRWVLVPDRSSARFSVRHFGVGTVHGSVPVTRAHVDVHGDGTVGTSAAVLDLDAIDTGNVRRDRDLHKPALLDLDRHPQLTFAGRPARVLPDGGWQVPGQLTARGVTVTVVLSARLIRSEDGTCSVAATTVLDRRALRLQVPRFLIGSRIGIDVTAVFALP